MAAIKHLLLPLLAACCLLEFELARAADDHALQPPCVEQSYSLTALHQGAD